MPNDHFIGIILKKERHKVYSKTSQFYQQIYFKLFVQVGQELLKFFVYSNYVNPAIFQTINQGKFSHQKVWLTGQRTKWGWILLDYQER